MFQKPFAGLRGRWNLKCFQLLLLPKVVAVQVCDATGVEWNYKKPVTKCFKTLLLKQP